VTAEHAVDCDALSALGLAQVDGDAALVARDAAVPRRRAVLVELAPDAQRVARRRLDLDDVGAEVAQDLAAEGAGDELSAVVKVSASHVAAATAPDAQLQHAHAGERSLGRRPLLLLLSRRCSRGKTAQRSGRWGVEPL
jgi:hypothetical protein